MGQVGHLGLARGVGQDRFALGQDRRHHGVFGGAHGDHGEDDVGALETVGRGGLDVTLADIDVGAQFGQRLEVQVHRAGADGAAAGQRHAGLAASRQNRPQNQHRGAHLADQIVGRGGAGDGPRRQLENAPGVAAPGGVAVHMDVDAQLGQQVCHGRDVDQVRQVGQAKGAVGKQARGHQRQRRVLGAADTNGASQRRAAADMNAIHEVFPKRCWRVLTHGSRHHKRGPGRLPTIQNPKFLNCWEIPSD